MMLARGSLHTIGEVPIAGIAPVTAGAPIQATTLASTVLNRRVRLRSMPSSQATSSLIAIESAQPRRVA